MASGTAYRVRGRTRLLIYILDTEHLSILERDCAEAVILSMRLAGVHDGNVAVTIITYEEQMRGWMAYISKANTSGRQVQAYRKLRAHVERYRRIPLLDYDEKAAAEFELLRRARLRIGTMDLKIAAIALVNQATILTSNLSDFRQVPGLTVEDWSV